MEGNHLDDSQFALPGLTCNSAICNKILFCDLLRQTLQSGIMTDYELQDSESLPTNSEMMKSYKAAVLLPRFTTLPRTSLLPPTRK
jgi:hypothetical protein